MQKVSIAILFSGIFMLNKNDIFVPHSKGQNNIWFSLVVEDAVKKKSVSGHKKIFHH